MPSINLKIHICILSLFRNLMHIAICCFCSVWFFCASTRYAKSEGTEQVLLLKWAVSRTSSTLFQLISRKNECCEVTFYQQNVIFGTLVVKKIKKTTYLVSIFLAAKKREFDKCNNVYNKRLPAKMCLQYHQPPLNLPAQSIWNLCILLTAGVRDTKFVPATQCKQKILTKNYVLLG